MRFSIIIANYNYGRFVAQAIESALRVDWPDKEVIVVDDGSTDDSRMIIESFCDRITGIFTVNHGQATAYNLGFERSSGDMIIFLDADDLLLSSVAKKVASVWRPGVTKVQYGMIYVDETLETLGRCWPVYTESNTPEWVARSMRETGAYMGSLLASGWSRSFVNEVMPLPTREEGLHSIDVYLQILAPFFGDVVSLTTPQYVYRQHRDNHSRSASLEKYNFLVKQMESVYILGEGLLKKKNLATFISRENEYYTKVCLIAKRFFPIRNSELIVWSVWRYWRAVWRGKFSRKKKAFLILWSLGVLMTPRPVARWITFSRDGHHMAGTVGYYATIVATLRRVLE